MLTLKLNEAFSIEHRLYHEAAVKKHFPEKWFRLERMHILGQSDLKFHAFVHWLMFREAINERKIREIFGQALRLIFVVPAHIFSLLPIGNVGTTRASFQGRMDIPADLKPYFD